MAPQRALTVLFNMAAASFMELLDIPSLASATEDSHFNLHATHG